MIIKIDGKECSCERGEFLLDVAKRNRIPIPSLCFHESLGGLGACRVCIVEVVDRGRSDVVTSCIYPINKEIEVFTRSEKIKEMRGVILTLLARLAPNAEIVRQLAAFSGADLPRLSAKPDGDTCILCGRCTTACELVGSGAIAKVNRGIGKAIDTPYALPSSECIGCASCAHVCPTDSIPYTETETMVEIWGRTFELQRCAHCGKPISTNELIASAAHFAREDGAVYGALNEAIHERAEGEETLCLACRKKAVAKKVQEGAKL